MASLVLSGDTSGSVTIAAPAVAGSNTQTLVATTGTLAPIVSGTSVSASGTSVDFTSIPSWVKRITVMFSGVSTNGSSLMQVQIGDSGGVENTGYAGETWQANTNNAALTGSGFVIGVSNGATFIAYGTLTINLLGSNTWVATGIFGRTVTVDAVIVGASKTLSDTLDRVRITTVNGTDTFDAGSINILYE